MRAGCPQLYRAGNWHRKCGNNPADMDAHTAHGTSSTPRGGNLHCLGQKVYPRERRFLQTSAKAGKFFFSLENLTKELMFHIIKQCLQKNNWFLTDKVLK